MNMNLHNIILHMMMSLPTGDSSADLQKQLKQIFVANIEGTATMNECLDEIDSLFNDWLDTVLAEKIW